MLSTNSIEAATAKEDFFIGLMADHPLPTWLIHPEDFSIRYANKAASSLNGYHTQAGSTPNFLDLFTPDTKTFFFQAVTRKDTELKGTAKQIRNGKDAAWVKWYASPLQIESGLFLQVTMVDLNGEMSELETIREDRRRYQTYIENSSEGIFCHETTIDVSIELSPDDIINLIAKNSVCTECNAAFASMYGYSDPSQMKGKITEELIDFNEPINREYFRQFIKNGYRTVNAESHEKDRFGNSRYFLNNMIGILEDGLLKRVWGTQRDITDEKRKEQELQFLANLVEHSSDILTAADLNFRPITWNKAAESIYGVPAEQVIGKDLREFISISYYNHTREEVRALLARDGSWRGEAFFERLTDGKQITVLIGFKQMTDGAGALLGYLINATDITERKESESRLRESESRFHDMADSSPAMVWMTDENGCITYQNSACLRFIGNVEVRNSEDWGALIHEHDHQKVFFEFQKHFNNRQPLTLNYRLRRQDGHYRWVHDVMVPRFLHGDQFIGYIGSMVDLEEEKQKEEQLLYQATILENVSDIIVTTDLNFRVRVWNKIAEQYYERPEEAAIGQHMNELVQFSFPETTAEVAMADLQKNGIWKGEVSIVNKKGEQIYLHHTVKYVYDENHIRIGYLATGRDITDLKVIEKKLKKSEQFYRTLIADSLDGMLLMDIRGMITFCSPSVKNVLGYEVEEVLGKNAFDFVHPTDIGFAFESFQKEVIENPDIKFIVIRLLKKNGEWLWCMVRGHNMLNNPAVNKIVIYFHDDTMRKQASDALKESEKRFRTLIQDMHTGVLLQDSKGNIIMSNNAMYRMFDISEELLHNKQIWNVYSDVVHENGRAFRLEERPSYRALKTKKIVSDVAMGVWHPRKNERIWIIITADPVLDEQGDVKHIICSFTDITERKKMDEDLLAKQIHHQKQLTQASIDGQESERREIGKELHDNIGQQLTTIKLFIDLAKSTADEPTNEMLNMAVKGVSDVINEIRAMSRSLVPSTLKDLGLVESVNDLIDSIERTQLLQVHFDHVHFSESALAENQKLTVFRIIQEQMNNVVKHSGAKNVWIRLSISGDFLYLLVKDDGSGFDDKTIRRGLGFINMKNRAELFNGKAEIYSTPGEGCQVEVSLPLAGSRSTV